MPKMKEPRDLFIHELGDILYAERMIVKMLPSLAKEASDKELVEGFERHLEETKQQIENLEKVFEELGEPVKAEKCPGIEGLKKEHDSFVSDEEPSQEILDLFDVGSAARVEHYEIAAYTGLVTSAKAMGETKAAKLLQENLDQEKAMLEGAETIAKRLAKQPAGATA